MHLLKYMHITIRYALINMGGFVNAWGVNVIDPGRISCSRRVSAAQPPPSCILRNGKQVVFRLDKICQQPRDLHDTSDFLMSLFYPHPTRYDWGVSSLLLSDYRVCYGHPIVFWAANQDVRGSNPRPLLLRVLSTEAYTSPNCGIDLPYIPYPTLPYLT